MFSKLKILFILIFLTGFFVNHGAIAQSVLEDSEDDLPADGINSEAAPNLVTETIKTISPSKKIFILSNENQSFSGGDFVTLLLANKLVCRALVAKTNSQKLSGIKIIKIYNSALWKQLNPGKEILILKGDDSYFTNKEKAPEKMANSAEKDKAKKKESKLQTDDDLFNSTSLENEDDLSVEENNKRLIKPDNLLSFNVGLIDGQDVDGSAKKYTSLGAAWGYQLGDNIWAEAMVGTNTVRDYPFTGLDSQMINIEVRAKYTFNGPLYSYFQPYVGYQTILANSPGAGVDPGDGSRTAKDLQTELDLVQGLKKSTVVFGLTFLKRIVPGWFARFDAGSDIINGGLSIEF